MPKVDLVHKADHFLVLTVLHKSLSLIIPLGPVLY